MSWQSLQLSRNRPPPLVTGCEEGHPLEEIFQGRLIQPYGELKPHCQLLLNVIYFTSSVEYRARAESTALTLIWLNREVRESHQSNLAMQWQQITRTTPTTSCSPFILSSILCSYSSCLFLHLRIPSTCIYKTKGGYEENGTLTLREERSSSASMTSWMEFPTGVSTRSITWTTPFVAIWLPWMILAQLTVTTCV